MKKLLIFTIIILFVTTNSCQKYEEGPWLSLRTPKNRLENAKWKFTSFEINNIESIDSMYNAYINFYTEDTHGSKDGPKVAEFYNDNIGLWGAYYFTSNKEKFLLSLSSGNSFEGVGPFIIDTKNEWTILRLTHKDLWMECEYNNSQYKVKAENIN